MKNAYKKAGVDIDKKSEILKRVKGFIKLTYNKNVKTDFGTFGGVYQISKNKMLVASVDGVGTKLKIAQKMNIHKYVGYDIVNHCVNDILVMGAKPIFFLDYIGIGKVQAEVIAEVIKSLSTSCRENDCVLIAGETAEMPDVYKNGEYDLVGTIIGEIENGRIITGNKVKEGDIVIGFTSSGLHTNGYTLARKIFESKKISYNKYIDEINGKSGDVLLTPHRSYYKVVYPLIQKYFNYIHSIAHITGGGFYDNIARVIPKNTDCIIFKDKWDIPPIFNLIQRYGEISDCEMYKVFNMGIGLILVIDKNYVEKIANEIKEKVYIIGEIKKGKGKVIVK